MIDRAIAQFFFYTGVLTLAFNGALILQGNREAVLFVGIVCAAFNVIVYGKDLQRV